MQPRPPPPCKLAVPSTGLLHPNRRSRLASPCRQTLTTLVTSPLPFLRPPRL
ncbi:hypothetical protein BDA96_01G278100 [Sorghum bicolor]|uniref:Uncharacterized protein n=1 Tax=Sorghum bicolor TaxID=4558 RepID=A0A921S1J1_SORBI|nr:hypothetical protein BDA96_01G278100 [Sorghum bicolor]